jgi:chromosome segregation ATPase
VHPLTKLFNVLVCLLAVMIVPLVAVREVNTTKIRNQMEDAKAATQVATAELEAQEAIRMREATMASLAQKELEMRQVQLQQQNDDYVASVRRLEGQLSDSQSGQDEIRARIDMMAETYKAQQNLSETLVAELRNLRSRAVNAERQTVELEDQLGRTQSELEVVQAARDMLKEEVTRLNDERDEALGEISRYHAYIGELPTTRAGARGGSINPADRNLNATIINVRRNADSNLAEINAGSRDGVKKGWTLTIADGSKFLGKLVIENVDLNRATGRIELEDPENRGTVRAGNRAIARKGQ